MNIESSTRAQIEDLGASYSITTESSLTEIKVYTKHFMTVVHYLTFVLKVLKSGF